MMWSDLGADVVRVQRADQIPASTKPHDQQLRGRTIVEADLKNESDRDAVLELISRADILGEGFRPGVAERLGLGPDVCAEQNPRLIYGRMTGWGAGRSVVGPSGSRHQLPASHLPAKCDRQRRRAACSPVESRSRFRRRLDVSTRWNFGGTRRTHLQRARVNCRRGNGGRSVDTGTRDLGSAWTRPLARQTRNKHARHRCALLRHRRVRHTGSVLR